MYATQASIDPSLAALLQTAQMVTPDQKPTVAAQVAQAAQQKMQPQGIAQGMPQAQQDYQNAMPSMMRNMQQQQMQQMVQQAMQQKPAGIEGLPSNIRMADGGVVGYQSGGTPRTYGSAPDYEDARRLGIALSPYDSPEERKEKLERLQKMREFDKERQNFGDIPTEASASRDQIIQRAYADPNRARDVVGQDAARNMSPGRTMAPPAAASPSGQRLSAAMSAPTQFDVGIGALPALRRAAQMVGGQEREDILNKIAELESAQPRSMAQPTQAAAPSGIAAAVPSQPTLAGAMGDVEKIMPGTGTEPNRAALEELQRMRRERPASGIGSLAALQEEARVAEELKARRAKDAQFQGMQEFLLGVAGGGPSGGAQRGGAFRKSQEQQEILFAQEATIRAAKTDAIKEANEARKVGDQEKYVEALNKLSELERADKQVKAQLAGTTLQAQTTMRGQDIQAREGDLNRQARDEVKQLPSFDQQMAERAMNDWMRQNPGKTFSDAWEWYRGAGKGMDLKETSVELRALKDEEQQLLKRLEATFSSQERVPINARLEQISRDRVKLMGGTPTSAEPPRLPPQAVSQLKEGVVTKFANGQQWTLKNGQPTQVK